MRLSIRVHPGARRTEVGGRYGDGDPPVLVVRVASPAVEGRANRAVTDAIASALGVPKRTVRIVAGTSTRNKVIEVPDVASDLVARLLAR